MSILPSVAVGRGPVTDLGTHRPQDPEAQEPKAADDLGRPALGLGLCDSNMLFDYKSLRTLTDDLADLARHRREAEATAGDIRLS